MINALDSTLGTGKNEGTLQPTARLRQKVKHTWANVMLRPWAISNNDSYNSKEVVDKQLQHWSMRDRSKINFFDDIQSLYSQSESALAENYKNKFNLKIEDAQELAAWTLSIAYSSNFKFSEPQDYFSEVSPNNETPNPWDKIQSERNKN